MNDDITAVNSITGFTHIDQADIHVLIFMVVVTFNITLYSSFAHFTKYPEIDQKNEKKILFLMVGSHLRKSRPVEG